MDAYRLTYYTDVNKLKEIIILGINGVSAGSIARNVLAETHGRLADMKPVERRIKYGKR